MGNYYSLLRILIRRICVIFLVYQACRVAFILFNKSYFSDRAQEFVRTDYRQRHGK